MKAIEFFSGIGGFHQVVSAHGIEVVGAFDQDKAANEVYELNYGLKPNARNLDSIKATDIPYADLWWMSPPCAPYTVRGIRRDDEDRRAKSLLNLIELAACLEPKVLIVENVLGFAESTMLKRLKDGLRRYEKFELILCPTQFGIPMRRPRIFVCAIRSGAGATLSSAKSGQRSDDVQMQPISDFLFDSGDQFVISDEDWRRHKQVINLVDPSAPNEQAICFTSGYGKCWKASGSMIRMKDGRIRRFSPYEILKLLGFKDGFQLSEDIRLTKQWRLVGNTVEVRCVNHVLNELREYMVAKTGNEVA